jgi:hypothetical protein
MRTAVCASVAALLALHNVSEARAETSSRPGNRLYQGFALGGFGAAATLNIDDRQQHDEGGGVNVALNAAYLQGLLPHFGLGLFAGIGSAATAWSADRGEDRTRAQFALGPVFVGTYQPRRPNIEWRIGIPVGYTRAWFNPGQGRAVEEAFSTAHGMNLSLVAGIDILGKHHGGFIDLTYAFHLTWLTHGATLKSDESVRTKQSYRYFEQGAFLGFGYVYRF